jgi:hypothetical protein
MTQQQHQTGSRRSSGRKRNGAPTPESQQGKRANRFPTDTPYDDLPELTLSEGDVVTIFEVLDKMASSGQDAIVPAITIASWLAMFKGRSSGHAARRRTTFLRRTAPSGAASHSAQQYQVLATQMDNPEAEATARLVESEELVLRYIYGEQISLKRLEDSLLLVATQFNSLPGCKKLEGGARAMLAFVQLRRSDSSNGPRDERVYTRSLRNMQAAIELLGHGYDISNVGQIVATLNHLSTHNGSRASATSTTSAHARTPAHA